MSESRQRIVRPPKNKGGNLWAVVIGVALVVIIAGFLAWRLLPSSGMIEADETPPVAAPAGAEAETPAPAVTAQ